MSTSPVRASVATATMRPSLSNFGAKPLPDSTADLSSREPKRRAWGSGVIGGLIIVNPGMPFSPGPLSSICQPCLLPDATGRQHRRMPTVRHDTAEAHVFHAAGRLLPLKREHHHRGNVPAGALASREMADVGDAVPVR